MARTVRTNNCCAILAQICDPKIKFSTKTHLFGKLPCPKNSEMLFLVKKVLVGWFDSKAKVLSTSQHTPNPNVTHLYLKIIIFIASVKKNMYFSENWGLWRKNTKQQFFCNSKLGWVTQFGNALINLLSLSAVVLVRISTKNDQQASNKQAISDQ